MHQEVIFEDGNFDYKDVKQKCEKIGRDGTNTFYRYLRI